MLFFKQYVPVSAIPHASPSGGGGAAAGGDGEGLAKVLLHQGGFEGLEVG